MNLLRQCSSAIGVIVRKVWGARRSGILKTQEWGPWHFLMLVQRHTHSSSFKVALWSPGQSFPNFVDTFQAFLRAPPNNSPHTPTKQTHSCQTLRIITPFCMIQCYNPLPLPSSKPPPAFSREQRWGPNASKTCSFRKSCSNLYYFSFTGTNVKYCFLKSQTISLLKLKL